MELMVDHVSQIDKDTNIASGRKTGAFKRIQLPTNFSSFLSCCFFFSFCLVLFLLLRFFVFVVAFFCFCFVFHSFLV